MLASNLITLMTLALLGLAWLCAWIFVRSKRRPDSEVAGDGLGPPSASFKVTVESHSTLVIGTRSHLSRSFRLRLDGNGRGFPIPYGNCRSVRAALAVPEVVHLLETLRSQQALLVEVSHGSLKAAWNLERYGNLPQNLPFGDPENMAEVLKRLERALQAATGWLPGRAGALPGPRAALASAVLFTVSFLAAGFRIVASPTVHFGSASPGLGGSLALASLFGLGAFVWCWRRTAHPWARAVFPLCFFASALAWEVIAFDWLNAALDSRPSHVEIVTVWSKHESSLGVSPWPGETRDPQGIREELTLTVIPREARQRAVPHRTRYRLVLRPGRFGAEWVERWVELSGP